MATPSFSLLAAITLLALPGLTSLVTAQSTNSSNSPTTDIYFPGACPALCSIAGPSPANWTHIHSFSNLIKCDEPLLFDLNVQNQYDGPDSGFTARACMVDILAFTSQDVLQALASPEILNVDNSTQPLLVSASCGAKVSEIYVTYQVGGSVDVEKRSSSSSQPESEDVASAARNLANFMDSGALCGATILFAKSGSAVVGLYSGSQVAKDGAKAFLDSFVESPAQASQVCSQANAALTIGAYAAAIEDFSTVLGAVRSWTNLLCLNGSTASETKKMVVLVPTSEGSNSTANSTLATRSLSKPQVLSARADCRAIEVVSGDSCASLVSRCGISTADFTKYNPSSTLCSTLQVKQHVCCSSGTLPIYTPKPQSDGTCAVYTVAAGDGCYTIADSHYLKQSDIESFNSKTWGWGGCAVLQAGQVICLSTGNPPMPAAIQGTTCGPQVPGTQKPASGVDISGLNPCPLNACCDIWGYCGTTAEFCTKTPADTGAPGTAKPGTNGCISNCGTDMVNNGSPPAQFRSVAYFEAFDQERTCMRMSVTDIHPGVYTHVHFAFATVTSSWDVDISKSQDQFDKFLVMTGFRRVLSFGGWAFSTDQATFTLFRQATNAVNRDAFVNRLISFLGTHDLDGLDFDWEYPGAPDIPDITPGGKDEGSNYLAFLKLLKSKMPTGKTLSIALPASYWYLQGYPVKDMAAYVDYFIYMTYDLHGQWDVGNKWAIPSCEGGNCLRSHVNKTETLSALVMLTKAGVSSTKIVVGIASYGRSFRMADSSCSGPMCKLLGDSRHSQAYPGTCTGTSGYIGNAEINAIIKDHGNYSIVKTGTDLTADSNVLMYGNPGAVDWVAYMDGSIKTNRVSWIKGLNLGGTTDWAIDLQTMDYDDSSWDEGDNPNNDNEDDLMPGGCQAKDRPANLQDLADKADGMPNNCAPLYALDILYDEIIDALALFKVNSVDYDDKFGWYAQWTKDQIQDKLDAFVSIYKFGTGLKYMTCYYTVGGRKEEKGTCAGMPHFWEDDESWTIRFQLDDETSFFNDLIAETGIDRSWVVWGDHDDPFTCAADGGDTPRPGGGGNHPCRRILHHYKNIPRKAADDKIQVGNPKAVIEASMSNITALQNSILSTYLDVGMTSYDDGDNGGSPIDAVVAYSMPIFQMSEAISSMKEIKDIGAKAAADAKRNLILKILSIIFMVLPFVGEALGPLVGSVAAIARIALLISEAGNAAITIADIVADPSSAPFAIMGLIAGTGGAGAGRAGALEKASAARGLFKDSDLAKFPKGFRDKDALIQQMVKKTCHL